MEIDGQARPLSELVTFRRNLFDQKMGTFFYHFLTHQKRGPLFGCQNRTFQRGAVFEIGYFIAGRVLYLGGVLVGLTLAPRFLRGAWLSEKVRPSPSCTGPIPRRHWAADALRLIVGNECNVADAAAMLEGSSFYRIQSL